MQAQQSDRDIFFEPERSYLQGGKRCLSSVLPSSNTQELDTSTVTVQPTVQQDSEANEATEFIDDGHSDDDDAGTEVSSKRKKRKKDPNAPKQA